jgi:soluble lytic murein transglycosylase-like protein
MRSIAIAGVLLCAAAGSVLAGERVIFDDGRALSVRSWRIQAGEAVLELQEGGTLRVPAERIAGQESAPDEAAAEELTELAVTLATELRTGERWREVAGPYADLISGAAKRNGIDPALLTAVVKVESDFDAFAVSYRGACGLGQLMPATARRFATKDVFDPAQNLEGSARYLRWLLDRFGDRTDLALAGYNAGEGAVDRYGAIPPYRETLSYVVRVLDGAERLAAAP